MSRKSETAGGKPAAASGNGLKTQSLALDYIPTARRCQSPNYARAADLMADLAGWHLAHCQVGNPKFEYHFDRFRQLYDYEANLRILSVWQGAHL